jgi:hypothetical protein
MGGTSGGGTAHSSEVTRRVLLVEGESPLVRNSTLRVTSYEWVGPSLLVVPVVLLLTSGQFLLH